MLHGIRITAYKCMARACRLARLHRSASESELRNCFQGCPLGADARFALATEGTSRHGLGASAGCRPRLRAAAGAVHSGHCLAEAMAAMHRPGKTCSRSTMNRGRSRSRHSHDSVTLVRAQSRALKAQSLCIQGTATSQLQRGQGEVLAQS